MQPHELTVISWVLPQTQATKADNRRETTYPSERWARARIFGEAANKGIRERLVEAITDVAAGKNPVDAAVAGNLFHRSRPSRSNTTIVAADLTDRETEVLTLVAEGLANKEIARQLSISEKTVKNHINNIFSKLHVYDRTQAALYAIRSGLVKID